MPKYTVTGWRVVSQYASAEIEAENVEAARLAALVPDEHGATPLDHAGFEDCGDPEEVDEIRVTNNETEMDEPLWVSPETQIKVAALDLLVALKVLLRLCDGETIPIAAMTQVEAAITKAGG